MFHPIARFVDPARPVLFAFVPRHLAASGTPYAVMSNHLHIVLQFNAAASVGVPNVCCIQRNLAPQVACLRSLADTRV